MQSSYVFDVHEHHLSSDASVRRRNLREWRTPRVDFGFLDWNIYFHKGCKYSNEANENDVIMFLAINPVDKKLK